MTDIRTLIGRQKFFYKSLVSVYCPVLKETVYFTGEGFYHLLYKPNRRPRKLSERYLKLKCLIYVPEVIKNSREIFTVRKATKKVKGKIKVTVRWALTWKVNQEVVRVIAERVGTGKCKFLSVMPHNKRLKTKKRRRRS